MQTTLVKFAFATVTCVALGAAVMAPRVATSQGNGALEPAQVGEMVKAMGFETKVLNAEAGKEKYEFSVEKGDLNIPIAVEVSPSKRYIWFTVFLGEVTAIKDFGTRADALLRQNTAIQPCQFYVTKTNRLMLALAVENRGPVDAPLMRKSFEKVAEDVVSSKTLWSN